LLTDEVDDEAPVGAAARGAAEERHAVGGPGRRVVERELGEDDDVVAGVGVGVAEAEDGVVAPGDGEGGGRLRCPHHHGRRREQENREDAEHFRVGFKG